MQRILKLFSAIVLFFGCSAQSQQTPPPAVPHLIRFVGTAHNADRTPRGGTFGITFALYAESDGGTPLWSEVQNVQVDSGGHYTVLLGANSTGGVPAELFTSNEARWLGVQVEQEPEQPRVLLVSVPYALKAGDAETVGGHAVTDFVLTPTANSSSTTGSSGNTSGGSTAVKKSATSPAAPSSPVTTAGGTQNFLSKFDATGTNLINSLLFDNGMVGIGTTTPAFNLDVVGGMQAQAASFPQINFKQTGGGGSVAQEWRYQINPDGSYRIYDITGGIVPRFTLTQAGNIGVGTTSPTFNLDVVGGMQAQAPAFPQINFKQTGNGSSALQEYRYQINPDGSYHIYDITSGIKSRFTLTQAGNIGIGTDAPGFNLDVVGGIQAQGGSFPQINFKQTGGGGSALQEYRYQINPDGVYHIYDITHGVASRFVLTPAGNIGIGNDSPGQKLSVAGTIESTTGGFKFPDGSVQASAVTGGGGGTVTSVTAGAGLVSNPSPITTTGTLTPNFTVSGGDNGSATTVARGDHLHDTRYVRISPQSFSYSNASFSGKYAFSLFGAIPFGSSAIPLTGIGTIQVDGNGHITSGVMTEFESGFVCQANLTGTYSVNSSGQGTAIVTSVSTTQGCTGSTSTFSIQAAMQGLSVLFSESDNLAWLSGTALRQ